MGLLEEAQTFLSNYFAKKEDSEVEKAQTEGTLPPKGILKKFSGPGGSQPPKKTRSLSFSKDVKKTSGIRVGSEFTKRLNQWEKIYLLKTMGFKSFDSLILPIDYQAVKAIRDALPSDEERKKILSRLRASALLELLAKQGVDSDWASN